MNILLKKINMFLLILHFIIFTFYFFFKYDIDLTN